MKCNCQLLSGIILSTFLSMEVFAQGDALSLKNDGSSVVITVLAIIFIGLFVYMMMTDRKLSRLEKEVKEKKKAGKEKRKIKVS